LYTYKHQLQRTSSLHKLHNTGSRLRSALPDMLMLVRPHLQFIRLLQRFTSVLCYACI